jgi:hypothetical protein
MKELSSKITYKDRDYKLVFNLNVMEEIQDMYESVDTWGSLTDGKSGTEVNIKALVFGITAMINEGIEIDNEENGTNEPPMSHKRVARIISEIGFAKVTKDMNELVVESVKSDEKNE